MIEYNFIISVANMKSIVDDSSDKAEHAKSDDGSNSFSDLSCFNILTKQSESNENTGSNYIEDREYTPSEIMEWETVNIDLDEVSEQQFKSTNDDYEEEK